ncbi:MAG: signal peptide peptidase SppA [Gammaproteobacteria bacterium]|jgi:protease-4|nr:signal peptide peptidase SppA [Gammaproteobacteria bacterium]|tara:strand:- start:2436 stop:4274 length:1839 start_codon:yes stop_codon:yes gene_type:complete
MTRFISQIWKGVTAAKNATGNILFVLLLTLLVFAIFTADSPAIPDSTALILNPTGIIVDQKRVIDPFSEFLSGYDETEDPETLLRDILEALESASTDDRVKSLVLDLRHLRGASMSKLEEIGVAIDKFKASGKPVFAFAPNYSQSQYLIAVHASKIYLDQQSYQTFGGVFFTGLSLYPTYFKSALAKLKVNFHVFKAGLYKGAVEPVLRDDMSEAAKEANLDFIGVLWEHYRDTIVSQRDITRDSFEKYANQYDELLAGVDDDGARLAIEQGFVDGLITVSDWRQEMQSISGVSGNTFNQISLGDYLLASRPPLPVVNPRSEKIAIITAIGTILEGDKPAGEIGGDSLSTLIRQAREDKQIKALVVRIDSPGGSSSASEQIRNELELTQKSGKPVIISMSGYAASGGYWIASTANKIFAAATTVTGSIGVFVLWPTFEQSITELGINSDGVGTTSLRGAFNALEEINPVMQKILELKVDSTYSKFLGLVARGREMSVDDVDKIAQGRVWAGRTAVELGLVDAIGSLDDAVQSAALLTDLEDYDVVYLEKELSPKDRLIQQILNSTLKMVHMVSGGFSSHWQLLGEVPREISDILQMSRSPGIYLQCVYCRVD